MGDAFALNRFRKIYQQATEKTKQGNTQYDYRLITNDYPQINFIILEHINGTREVLFNWNLKGIGQDPIVLMSRNKDIIEMFSYQFAHLWRTSSQDHDDYVIKSILK